MTDWGFLSELFGSLQAHSPMLGRLWLLLMLIFRMLILGTVASDMFSDEQEEFSCNTLQPGCKQVCYDQAFPISQYRFWVFHIVLISTPALVFLMYAMHHNKKHQVPAKDSTISILQADQDLHIKRLYLVNVAFRTLSEVAFLIGQWKLYGFRVEAQFPCSHFPCPHTVDCFTSRPMEKTVFLLFYFAIGILSVVSSLAEFIHIIFKWFTKSSEGLQSLVLEDTKIQEESKKTHSTQDDRKTKAGVEKPGRSREVPRVPARTGRTKTNAGTRKSSIRRKSLGEHHCQKGAELIV
ncbi:gap junction delta-3 protein-like [Clarias gariepinus]|uniref:gap junction delta-3 protein-like n=1 Tax=Clarias gariepinus TaxID=13013 RepID=UPI00234CB198|nr:gap junction delta-3 protein-like [Clarias gariepinus]